MTYHKSGLWYYSIPKLVKIEDNVPENVVISLDPGVRTFQTGYDPTGNIYEIGKGDMKKVFHICRRIDKLRSKYCKEKRKRNKKRQKRARLRKLREVRHKIDEVHNKACSFLCKRYKFILLPELKVQPLAKKLKGKRSRTKLKISRELYTWGHYRFRENLKAKAETVEGSNVVDEHYTSMTCGKCGKLNRRLVKSKTFKCPHCNSKFDRDINASRNILLRYLMKIGAQM